MGQKIIIPAYQMPPLSSFSVIYDHMESITQTFQNSSIVQAAEAAAREARRINEMFDTSAIFELQIKQKALSDSISQMTSPVFEAMQRLTDSLPTYIFQPIVYDAPPQKTYQKPSIDLPQVLIVSRKASLHFNGVVLEIGNANTQPVKAVQHFCNRIGEEIDLAELFMQCKNKDRAKHTSRREVIDLPARYSRGKRILFELYRIEGFSTVFRLKSNHKTVIPYLA